LAFVVKLTEARAVTVSHRCRLGRATVDCQCQQAGIPPVTVVVKLVVACKNVTTKPPTQNQLRCTTWQNDPSTILYINTN